MSKYDRLFDESQWDVYDWILVVVALVIPTALLIFSFIVIVFFY